MEDGGKSVYTNDKSIAQDLAVKILMKKRQDAGLVPDDMTEEQLRRIVVSEMKSELWMKMERMIESLKWYRANFKGDRVPTFLMTKE